MAQLGNNAISRMTALVLSALLTMVFVAGAAADVRMTAAVTNQNSVTNTFDDNDQHAAAPTTTTGRIDHSDHSAVPRPREDVAKPDASGVLQTAATVAADDQVRKVTSRYEDPAMVSFLRGASMSRLASLYLEASQMIDARHVTPPAYEQRTRTALMNLVTALDSPSFLRAAGAANNPNAIRRLQDEFSRMAQYQPARSANEAVGLMQWAAETAYGTAGIRREAVALEFLNGTIDGLDKYSAFLPSEGGSRPGARADLIQTAGLDENIVGVGIEMKPHDLGALLVGVVENSPASDLGLQAGDILIAINQRSLAGMSLSQIANLVSGPAGSQVTFDIQRDGRKYRGSTVRRSIYISSVTGTKMIDPSAKVGYVRLKQFSDSSAEDLQEAMWSLHRQGMRSLILDLRGNPGGLLDESIDVSNLFLPCGSIVSTRGRNASDNTAESASFEKTWSTPLVVLVDGNSASASEIFAAAIQENGRGVVVGRQSYGKGTVQTHFPLQTVAGTLKLTTAKFYSPTGREMAGAGVTPDVLVTDSNGLGNLTDADVIKALETFQRGTPAQLAQTAGQCRNPQARYNAGSVQQLSAPRPHLGVER